MHHNEPITHDKSHPMEASAGPDNAYYLKHCPEVERQASYTSCLSRIRDIDAGRENERTAQCRQAYRGGRCVAAGMREQEKLAGQALFYFPRLNKPFLPAKVAGDFGVLITNQTDPALYKAPPKPAMTPPRPPIEQGGDYAAAINAALAESAEIVPPPSPRIDPPAAPVTIPVPPPAPMTIPPARPAMEPGETPLQYARRLAALKNNPPTT